MSEWSKEPDSKSGVVLCITEGSNPSLSVLGKSGEVSEWSKVHDWKSCMVESHRGFESPPLRSAAESKTNHFILRLVILCIGLGNKRCHIPCSASYWTNYKVHKQAYRALGKRILNSIYQPEILYVIWFVICS